MLRIGLILTGCGLLDGTDPLTAIAMRIAASRAGDLVFALAPDLTQPDVIGLTGPVHDHRRNALAESARLSAGRIDSLARAHDDEFDVLAVPGGLGVLKTLCAAEPVLGATLAHGVLARGGALLVLDEGAAWAAGVAATRETRGWSIAVGTAAHVRDRVERAGHEALDATGTWIEERSHAVFSCATASDLAAHRMLELCAEGIELARSRLRRDDAGRA